MNAALNVAPNSKTDTITSFPNFVRNCILTQLNKKRKGPYSGFAASVQPFILGLFTPFRIVIAVSFRADLMCKILPYFFQGSN